MTERDADDQGQVPTTHVTGYFVPLRDESPSNHADLSFLWRKLLRGKTLLVGTVIAATVVAALVAFTRTPVYRSEILLAPAQVDDNRGQFSALIGQYAPVLQPATLTPAEQSKDLAVAILTSRKFTEEFIAGENLLPVLFADAWDAETESWTTGQAPSLAEAVALFSESVRSVHEDNRRNLVTLRIEWTDRELAAYWANQLVTRLNDYLRQRDIDEAQRSIEFLNEELTRSSVIGLQQGIYRLIEHQIEMVMLANVRDEYAFEILDPAVPAEAGDYVRPRRLLILIVGLMLGLFLGISIALLRPE